MVTALFILSAWLLIASFGIHMQRQGAREFDQPRILDKRFMGALPWIGGFVLPVVPIALLTNIHWLLIFLLNLFFVYIAGPLLTNAYMVRFAGTRGMARNMLAAFVIGFIALVAGLLMKYYRPLVALIQNN